MNNKVINTADELREEVINFLTKNQNEFTLEANNEGVLFIWKAFDEDGINIKVDMTFYETFQFVKNLISSFNYENGTKDMLEFAKEKLANTSYVSFSYGDTNYYTIYHYSDIHEDKEPSISLDYIVVSNSGYITKLKQEEYLPQCIKKESDGRYIFKNMNMLVKIPNELYNEIEESYNSFQNNMIEKISNYKKDAKSYLTIA